MSVVSEKCTFCAGNGECETWTEAKLPGGLTIQAADCMDNVKEDLTAGLYPNTTLNWHVVECPCCNGRGSYPVEVFQGVAIF